MKVSLICLRAIGKLFGFRSWDWNQKLTVEVETPSGSVTGSSIVHVHREQTPQWLGPVGGGGMGYRLAGEAAVVEVLPETYLFALLCDESLSDSYHAYLPFRTFFPGKGTNSVEVAEALERRHFSKEVNRKDYPLFVMFADADDPMSVQKVDPADFHAFFGPGSYLRSVTLETTDEPLNQGRVGDVLKWFAPLNGGYLHGGSTSFGAPLDLHGGHFSTRPRR